MKYLSPAKINLALDIVGKDDSGYHMLTTVLHQVGLADEIEIERCESGIHLSCSDSSLPLDDSNLAYKAVCAVKIALEKRRGPLTGHAYEMPEDDEYGGLKIHIEKKIPVGAGLGGGSSNAATMLKACNEIWELKWSRERLIEIGGKIGVDVPFFINGGTAIGTHYGEILEPVKTELKLNLVILHPGKSSMTAEMYELLDKDLCGRNAETTKVMIDALRNGKEFIADWIGNDFDTLSQNASWELGLIVNEMHSDLRERGAVKTCMSGSGSAVYGVFESKEAAKSAAGGLEDKYPFVWCSL